VKPGFIPHFVVVAGVFLLVAILSFPAGWDNSSVVGVCGPLVREISVSTRLYSLTR
jgi:hypothetical protein